MTKNLTDDDLKKIAGAGDKAVQADLDKELVTDDAGGPGGPSPGNEPTADGANADPGDLDRS